MGYWIFDFPRIYGGFSRAVLRSVSLGGGFFISHWVFPFPKLDFPFPNPDFLCRIRIFCAEHHTYIAPGPRGTEGLPLPLPFPVAFPVSFAFPVSVSLPVAIPVAITVTADQRSGADADAETGSHRQICHITQKLPCPSRPSAYSSSVGRAHIVRGRVGYPEDRRRAGAWIV